MLRPNWEIIEALKEADKLSKVENKLNKFDPARLLVLRTIISTLEWTCMKGKNPIDSVKFADGVTQAVAKHKGLIG